MLLTDVSLLTQCHNNNIFDHSADSKGRMVLSMAQMGRSGQDFYQRVNMMKNFFFSIRVCVFNVPTNVENSNIPKRPILGSLSTYLPTLKSVCQTVWALCMEQTDRRGDRFLDFIEGLLRNTTLSKRVCY